MPRASSLTGWRRPSFRYVAVNANGVPTGTLDRISSTSGSLEFSQQAEIRGSGLLERALAAGATAGGIRIDYILDEGLSTERAWPLGVFTSASPITTYGEGTASSSVEVYDGLSLLAEDAIESALMLPAGTNVMAEVRNQLAVVGATQVAITEASKALRADAVWPVGTSRLRIVNDLLEAADYFALWCDGQGIYRAEPYLPPAQRGISWNFRAGADSIFVRPFTVDNDTYSIPNKVIGISREDGVNAPLISVDSIKDTSSPYHRDNLGRWRVEVMRDVEVTTQEDLDAKVSRRLLEASQVVRVVTLRHAWVPLAINGVVTFDCDGVAGLFVLTNQRVPLDPEQLVTSTFREVMAA